MKKKLGLFVAVLALIFSILVPTQASLAAAQFPDVPNDFWAKESIERFVNEGIINGYQDGKFYPNKEITRAQAAIILAGVLDLDTENATTDKFKDVEKDHYAYNFISAVTNEEIMIGNNGYFNPDQSLTRAEMAVLLTNVFDFDARGEFPFKDVSQEHWAYEYIHAIYANNVTVGYDDQTFRPDNTTTRAEFTTFLANAIDNDVPINELLAEIYTNEMLLDSYEYEGSVNLGIRLPEVEDSPEFDMISSILSDIQIDMTGSYQKDPMLMDAEMTVTLPGDIFPEVPINVVMSEEKMWMTLPEVPGAPLPEELQGKYIEFDLEELAALEGQPAPSFDMDLQTELALEIYKIFSDQFADFYERVNINSVEVPDYVEANQVLKFELSDENLRSFVETFLNGFFPQFIELLDNPEYQEAMGFTAEDIELIKEEFGNIEFDMDEIMAAINEVLTINNFEEYIVINKDNIIVHDTVDVDVDLHFEGETFGLKFYVEMGKSNVNGDVTIVTPTEDQVIPLEEFEKIIDEQIEELPAEAL